MINCKSIIELTKTFHSQQTCIEYLEELLWNGMPVSPFDKTSKVYKCKNNRYRCKNTGKYFNVLTNTLFHNTKVELQKWFLAIWLVNEHKKGYSSIQLSKDINVTQKTAWFLLHRIRNCFGSEKVQPEMVDNTQLDETFVGGKNKNRHFDKKVAKSQGRSHKDKTPVMGMISGGKVRAFVIPTTGKRYIQEKVFKYVPLNSTIISDEWKAYQGLNKFYHHEVVDHGRKQYVNDCGFTSNGIENFWSIFKRGIIGIYHSTSKKHLQRYVDEFVFRRNILTFKGNEKFEYLLSNIENTKLPYKTLIAA